MLDTLEETVAADQALYAGLSASLNKTRAAFNAGCDSFPQAREVELLRFVVDRAGEAAQSVNRAVAASFATESVALTTETRRWLEPGGVRGHRTGALPSWREPESVDGEPPPPLSDAMLAPRLRPFYINAAVSARSVARSSVRTLRETIAWQLRTKINGGAYQEAHDIVDESHIFTAQTAEAHMNGQLVKVLDAVADTATLWWRQGEWLPPKIPQLIRGAFWQEQWAS